MVTCTYSDKETKTTVHYGNLKDYVLKKKVRKEKKERTI